MGGADMIKLLAVLAMLAIPLAGQTDPQHGGGCRKDSPKGQCCHKQKSTGKVHCHDK